MKGLVEIASTYTFWERLSHEEKVDVMQNNSCLNKGLKNNLAITDEPIHNFKASIDDFFVDWERRMADYKAPKLWKGNVLWQEWPWICCSSLSSVTKANFPKFHLGFRAPCLIFLYKCIIPNGTSKCDSPQYRIDMRSAFLRELEVQHMTPKLLLTLRCSPSRLRRPRGAGSRSRRPGGWCLRRAGSGCGKRCSCCPTRPGEGRSNLEETESKTVYSIQTWNCYVKAARPNSEP